MLEQKIEELTQAVNSLIEVMQQGGEKAEPKQKPKSKKKTASSKKKAAVPSEETLKAAAAEIAKSTDNPKDCMEQIRELISEVAEEVMDDSSVGFKELNDDAKIELAKRLSEFRYESSDDSEESSDDFDI